MTLHSDIQPTAAAPTTKAWTHERVLVIGGRGFVGSAIVRALLSQGLRPAVFGPVMQHDLLRDVSGQFDEIVGSIEDADATRKAVQHASVSAIVHTAAFSAGAAGLMRSGEADKQRALSVNVLGFANVLNAALEADVQRVVWTSSSVVYGPPELYKQQAVDEQALPAPQTHYGLSKQLAEELARYYRNRYALDVTGLRLPLVLGPDLWYQGAAHGLMQLFEAASRAQPYVLKLHDDPMDLMHAADVADAVLSVLQHTQAIASPVYNINGSCTRATELLAVLRQLYPGASLELEHVEPLADFPVMDDSRFRKDFAWNRSRTLAELCASLACAIQTSAIQTCAIQTREPHS